MKRTTWMTAIAMLAAAVPHWPAMLTPRARTIPENCRTDRAQEFIDGRYPVHESDTSPRRTGARGARADGRYS
jgi:hypothetical protein